VWSFGVALWEVFSYAAQPYSELSEADEVAAYVLEGGVLLRPDPASVELYDLMRGCCALDSWARPSFEEVHRALWMMEDEERLRCSNAF